MSIYSYTFKSVIFESVILESIKIKIFSKSVKMIQKSFLRISENDIFESVKVESVRVDRHPHSQLPINHTDMKDFYLLAQHFLDLS